MLMGLRKAGSNDKQKDGEEKMGKINEKETEHEFDDGAVDNGI